ncbi:MFS transporter [Solirhodobacter olei]|uniref:MFS transporter n=1 Tax=Solirhodobacter olei TaxID=2493082 RepID=UPI001F4E74CF|nr:MFS transporter [Solirhodobacter olei]
MLAGLGLAALAAGGLVCAAAPGPGMVALGRLVSAAGALFSTLYFTKMIADWFDGREMATAMSVLVMSWPFGIAMGQEGHAWIAQHYGWHVPFAVASAYCALASLGVLGFCRPPNAQTHTGAQRIARLLPREWALILCAGIAWGVFNGGYVTWLSFGPRMLEATGTGVLAAASVISVGSWLMIFSGAACGQIVDRFGHADTVLEVCMTGAVGGPVPPGGARGGSYREPSVRDPRHGARRRYHRALRSGCRAGTAGLRYGCLLYDLLRDHDRGPAHCRLDFRPDWRGEGGHPLRRLPVRPGVAGSDADSETQGSAQGRGSPGGRVMQIRKTMLIQERSEIDEMGAPCAPLIRVAALPVPQNPYAGIDQRT